MFNNALCAGCNMACGCELVATLNMLTGSSKYQEAVALGVVTYGYHPLNIRHGDKDFCDVDVYSFLTNLAKIDVRHIRSVVMIHRHPRGHLDFSQADQITHQLLTKCVIPELQGRVMSIIVTSAHEFNISNYDRFCQLVNYEISAA